MNVCKPVFYYDELNPQSRSCYMLIVELKLNVDLKPKECLQGNVTHNIPTLVDGGLVLNDSHTLLIYLCDRYATKRQAQICSREYFPRLQILNILFYEGCVLYRRYLQLVNDIIANSYPAIDIDFHKKKIINSYDFLEYNLINQCFMAGNCFTVADISVVTTLSSLDVIFPIFEQYWPNLFKWFEGMKKMHCYRYNAIGLHKLLTLLQKEGNFIGYAPQPKASISATSENPYKADKNGDKYSKFFPSVRTKRLCYVKPFKNKHYKFFSIFKMPREEEEENGYEDDCCPSCCKKYCDCSEDEDDECDFDPRYMVDVHSSDEDCDDPDYNYEFYNNTRKNVKFC